MDCLPDDMLLFILGHLSYQAQGRLFVVSKRWRRLIEELLPFVRHVIIFGKAKYKKEFVKGLDEYSLHSAFRGEPVYISNKKHRLGHALDHWWEETYDYTMVAEEDRLKRLFLHMMDGVWCASEIPGVMDEKVGYLKSDFTSSTPPEKGWAWY